MLGRGVRGVRIHDGVLLRLEGLKPREQSIELVALVPLTLARGVVVGVGVIGVAGTVVLVPRARRVDLRPGEAPPFPAEQVAQLFLHLGTHLHRQAQRPRGDRAAPP